MLKRKIGLLSLLLLLGSFAWGKVFVRWTEVALPATPLGISELVIAWDAHSTTLIRSARKHGYRVYVEVPLQQAAHAAALLQREAIAGLIIDSVLDQDAAGAIRKLRAAHPELKMSLLNTNGKQPQMRGQTVITSNGVLQVSSPTAQPWLDSNLALIRFQSPSDTGGMPVYTFSWELNDSLQQASGPSADDYALAIAESGAIHADLLLNLHQSLQKRLVEDQPVAWVTWRKMVSYLRFASGEHARGVHPWSNVGVITDNYDAAYEPMNLMARHNIPFRVVQDGVTAGGLQGLSLITVFTPPDQRGIDALNTFAKQGGSVIVTDAKGKYPWQSVQPVPTAAHALSYAAGKGRVIELTEPVSDPETFAQDVRRLMDKDSVLISLWNALTTIAVPYRDDRTGEVVVELVNYAEEPMRIQVQAKGLFSAITYETPDHGCCQDLAPVKHDGFTDFVIPSLTITGRVHMRAGAVNGSAKPK